MTTRPRSAAPESPADRHLTRPSDVTRRALISAAVVVFSDHGYDAASVRDITGRAKVNQGAITYHFGGKEGLYREVLRTAREALSGQPLLRPATVGDHPPREALLLFMRQTLAPLAEAARFKRYLRIFAWEQLKPTTVRAQLAREEPFPTIALAACVVRRLAPEADERHVAIATAWLIGQTATFIRDADWLAGPPINLDVRRANVEDLAQTLASLCHGGLAADPCGSADRIPL